MDETNATQTMNDSHTYTPPQVLLELELEVRAGSSLGLPDGLLDAGE